MREGGGSVRSNVMTCPPTKPCMSVDLMIAVQMWEKIRIRKREEREEEGEGKPIKCHITESREENWGNI